MIGSHLFRGVSNDIHNMNNGLLRPKENAEFKKPPKWNIASWGSSWSASVKNAINEHQQHQSGYPTSGISTTPHIERAMFYATHNGKFNGGVIYTIDPALCRKHSVSLYVVSEFVKNPYVPEDDEVILVGKDFENLPGAVVVDVYFFNT